MGLNGAACCACFMKKWVDTNLSNGPLRAKRLFLSILRGLNFVNHNFKEYFLSKVNKSKYYLD